MEDLNKEINGRKWILNLNHSYMEAYCWLGLSPNHSIRVITIQINKSIYFEDMALNRKMLLRSYLASLFSMFFIAVKWTKLSFKVKQDEETWEKPL